MKQTFFASRSLAREYIAAANFIKTEKVTVKDAGKDAPKGSRWYVEEPNSDVKIPNLLEVAKEAKKRFVAILNGRIARERHTNTVFICHLFSMEDKPEWQDHVEPFMASQFRNGGEYCNNIFSYVVGNDSLKPKHYRAAEIVRLHWLNALIAAAEKDGDKAEFPPIMSREEINKLLETL